MLPKDRYSILKRKLNLDLPAGKHKITVECELCKTKLSVHVEVYRTGNGQVLGSDMVLHHIDGDKENNNPENIMILCETCHRMLHNWGEIQRWLDKIGKKVEDLPDCRKLKPLIKRYGL